MSLKFEVNFESLFEHWSNTQYGDDIKAMTFYNKHQEKHITILSEE